MNATLLRCLQWAHLRPRAVVYPTQCPRCRYPLVEGYCQPCRTVTVYERKKP